MDVGRIRPAWILSAVVFALGCPVPCPGSAADEMREQGRFVYEHNCLPCHGKRGNGRGELAAGTKPRPRDFTKGLFKYRSTPSGFLPTDEDLRRTVRSGLPGTAMPAFARLPEADLEAVLAYVRSLSPRWRNPNFRAPPVAIPTLPRWWEEPESRKAHAAAGRRLFLQACANCHGADGAGNGPSAADLQDEGGEPCPPRDLQRLPLRAGDTPAALYRVLMTGLDGSPMPSFAEATTESERWDLVAFIVTLRDATRTHTAP